MLPDETGMSRRSLLRRLALTGVVAAGGNAFLSACTDDGDQGTTDVTLTVGGTPNAGPYGPMPTADQQAQDINAKGYAAALQGFLDKHPGVKFRHINFDVGDQQTLTTAIGGGTAPDMFIGNVLGSYNADATRRAFSQDLVADLTRAVRAHGFAAKLSTEVKPLWDYWTIDGRTYGLPTEATGGGFGIYLRRDLLEAAGVPTPAFNRDWTWEKVRQIARAVTGPRTKGFAWYNWLMYVPLGTVGSGPLTDMPTPATRWNISVDYRTFAAQTVPVVETVRGMLVDDQAALADLSYASKADALLDAFRSGKAAMLGGNVAALFGSASDDSSWAAVAARLGKKYEDVVTWLPAPYGLDDFYDGSGKYNVSMLSFRPDLEADAIDAGVALHTYMLGEGLVTQMETIYEHTNDLKSVWTMSQTPGAIPTATVLPIFETTKTSLPGSPERAWGKKVIAALHADTDRAPSPQRSAYLPAETNPAPSGKAIDDMISTLTFGSGVDVRAVMGQAQDEWNAGARGFTSAIDDATFVSGTRRWLSAMDSFWAQHGPDFHAGVFGTFRDRVLSNLGG